MSLVLEINYLILSYLSYLMYCSSAQFGLFKLNTAQGTQSSPGKGVFKGGGGSWGSNRHPKF